jgi:sugar lactone lactonase YvrE
VADGGGGVFADIWTPNTFAQEGFVVSDTKTPGHVYELSNEHHLRNEIRLTRVENWDLNAPQTEEEAGESPEALSLELDLCRNITIANYHGYRVTRSRAPFPAAVRLYNSSDIHFRNVHVNAESGYSICDENGCSTYLRVSKYPYENAIEDVTHHQQVREREFAVLDVASSPEQKSVGLSGDSRSESQSKDPKSAVILSEARSAESKDLHFGPVRKLEDGFFSIAGAAVDANGKLYFVDRHFQRIYGWSQDEGLTVERDNPLDPINLAIDKSGNLLVQSSAGPAGTVYTFSPGTSAEELTVLQPQPAQAGGKPTFLLPVNWWNNGEFKDQLNVATMRFPTLAELFAQDATAPVTHAYISNDNSTILPARRVFQQGPADEILGWRFSDNLDTHGFISAAPGDTVYVSSESEDITYRSRVQPDGTLADLHPFAQRGGESVAKGPDGNIYVANGQVFVYAPDGKQIDRIDVPERPLQVLFGGADGRTLFILAHHALYATKLH